MLHVLTKPKCSIEEAVYSKSIFMFHRLILTPNLQSNNKIHEHCIKNSRTLKNSRTSTNENEENYNANQVLAKL